MDYVPHTPEDQQKMMQTIGIAAWTSSLSTFLKRSDSSDCSICRLRSPNRRSRG